MLLLFPYLQIVFKLKTNEWVTNRQGNWFGLRIAVYLSVQWWVSLQICSSILFHVYCTWRFFFILLKMLYPPAKLMRLLIRLIRTYLKFY